MKKWEKAIKEEKNSLKENDTREEIDNLYKEFKRRKTFQRKMSI